jgi:hypothetical protein
LLYITALALTKVSILFFYLKVFPKRSVRISVYVLIGLNILYNLSYVLILVFQCNPINGAWLGWTGEYTGKCISINILGWSAAAINIALDLATIILPLPELYRLSMSYKKKAQIMIMFTIGFLYVDNETTPGTLGSERLTYLAASPLSAHSACSP